MSAASKLRRTARRAAHREFVKQSFVRLRHSKGKAFGKTYQHVALDFVTPKGNYSEFWCKTGGGWVLETEREVPATKFVRYRYSKYNPQVENVSASHFCRPAVASADVFIWNATKFETVKTTLSNDKFMKYLAQYGKSVD